MSIQIDENSLHEILNEVDLNKNGQVELDEFLQVHKANEILECRSLIIHNEHIMDQMS